MKSVVKERKTRNQSCKETEHCNCEVLHKATVINSLGDQPNLPFLFGGVYGKRGKSLTLHKFVKARMLKKTVNYQGVPRNY